MCFDTAYGECVGKHGLTPTEMLLGQVRMLVVPISGKSQNVQSAGSHATEVFKNVHSLTVGGLMLFYINKSADRLDCPKLYM